MYTIKQCKMSFRYFVLFNGSVIASEFYTESDAQAFIDRFKS